MENIFFYFHHFHINWSSSYIHSYIFNANMSRDIYVFSIRKKIMKCINLCVSNDERRNKLIQSRIEIDVLN